MTFEWHEVKRLGLITQSLLFSCCEPRLSQLSPVPCLTSCASAAMSRAQQIAIERQSATVGTAHLALALLEDEAPDATPSHLTVLLLLSGVGRQEARLYAESVLEFDANGDQSAPRLNDALKKVQDWARAEAHYKAVGPEHLLIALMRPQSEPHVGEVLRPLGLKPEVLRAHLRAIQAGEAPEGKPLRMLDGEAQTALRAAHAAMRLNFCGRISTAHLLLGLIDSPLRFRKFAEKHGVDWEALRAQAAKAQGSDGLIGGPQLQLSPGAKRALERAKASALRNRQTRIAPEDVLRALLPRAASWRERLRWGNRVDDPLERVWARFDSAPLERTLRALPARRLSTASTQSSSGSPDWVRVDWRLMVLGMAWHGWMLVDLGLGMFLALLATLVAVVLAALGSMTGWRELRDAAASWLYGMVVALLLLPFALAIWR